MEKRCWLCGRNGSVDPLDEHHIFEGWANRAVSEKYDVTVRLCHHDCHIFGRNAAHNSRETADLLHRYGQRRVMLEQGWTVEEFRLAFGRNWLDEDEIEEVYAIQRGEAEETDDGSFQVTDEVVPDWIAA